MGRINIQQSHSLRPPRDGESDGRAADGVSQNIPQVLCVEGSEAHRLILSDPVWIDCAYTVGLRWNHSILYLCHYVQLWINPGYDAHQEGSRGKNNLPLLEKRETLSTGLIDK